MKPNERKRGQANLQKKVTALKAYKTQEGKDYMSPEFIRSLAVVRGTQVGFQYAEAFEAIRLLL